MPNSIPYTPPPGTLATLICVPLESYDVVTDAYDESDLIELEVIFDDRSMPCQFEKVSNRYEAGYDIYCDGFIPLKIKTIHKFLPKGE